MICVHDVEACSLWYQQLLGWGSAHGGREYERLVSADGTLLLQLHRWDVEHHHGPIGDPRLKPYGNGVLLWFSIPVEDFEAAVSRAGAMGVEVLKPRHMNPPDGNGGPNHWELWVRDPEGYTVVLASPDGSGVGDWRP